MKTQYKNMAFLRILMKRRDPVERFMAHVERAGYVLAWIAIAGAVIFIIIPALVAILEGR